MRKLFLTFAVALLIIPAAGARNWKAELSYDGTNVTGCGYRTGEVYLYFLWYPTDGPAAYPQEVELDTDSAGCISTTWPLPTTPGNFQIRAFQENKPGNQNQLMSQFSLTIS